MNLDISWSWLANNGYYEFDPEQGDQIFFYDPQVTATGIFFDTLTYAGQFAISTYENKTVRFEAMPGEIASTTFVFTDGSLLLVGDTTIGTINDSGDNTLTGGAAGDQLQGLGGNDRLNGNGGNDFLNGGDGDDTLNGGDGTDFLFDLNGANVLNGNAGDDYYFAFTLPGGSGLATDTQGRDTYYTNAFASAFTVQGFTTGDLAGSDVINISAALTASALQGYYQGGDPQATGFLSLQQSISNVVVKYDFDGSGGGVWTLDTVLTVNNVNAASLASNITGYVLGTIGNDALTGDASNQMLFSAAGSDTLDGGAGADNLFGGLGGDVYVVDDRGDTVNESSNVSALSARLLPGGPEAQAGLDDIIDTVLSAVNFSLTNEFVENLTLTGAAAREAKGNSLNNRLQGNALGNLLEGLDGNDTLIGGAGNDTLEGGLGNDVFVLEGADSWSDSGGIDTIQLDTSFTLTVDSAIENVTLTGGALTATGNDFANALTGNAFANSLTGNGGNDTLSGGAGDDTLVGGAGDDLYVTGSAGDKVLEALGAGTDTVQSTVTRTLEANVDNLVLLGAAALGATGNGLDNVLTGNSGSNTLSGGLGNDTLIGGGGADTYLVGQAGDVVTEAFSQGIDTVQSTVARTLGDNQEHLTLLGAGDIAGTGNGAANQLTGNSGDNDLDGLGNGDKLTGLGGNDTLNGGIGNDTMIGGTGSDTYLVNAAGDVVTELDGQGTDTEITTVTDTLSGYVERLTLSGAGDINGIGNALGNIITGNSGDNSLDGAGGADTLKGLGGHDTLAGGTGIDRLLGGIGNDTMVWDALDEFFNGEGGTDTLRVDGASVAIDLRLLPDAKIQNVEVINLTGSGNNELKLAFQNVLDDSGTDTLRIDGNTGDEVRRGTGWTTGVDVVIGPNTYYQYTNGLATLLVDNDITGFVAYT